MKKKTVMVRAYITAIRLWSTLSSQERTVDPSRQKLPSAGEGGRAGEGRGRTAGGAMASLIGGLPTGRFAMSAAT